MKFAILASIMVLSSYCWSADSEVTWNCELLNSILNSETSYCAMKDWMEKMEERELDETEYERVSGGPGLYRLINTKLFNWKSLQVEPFMPEIRILGKDPRKPDGYFIKLHRMFGFVMIYGDKDSVWIDKEFFCSERERIFGFNMPESVLKGPTRGEYIEPVAGANATR